MHFKGAHDSSLGDAHATIPDCSSPEHTFSRQTRSADFSNGSLNATRRQTKKAHWGISRIFHFWLVGPSLGDQLKPQNGQIWLKMLKGSRVTPPPVPVGAISQADAGGQVRARHSPSL